MSIVEVAAWIIIGDSIDRWYSRSRKQKRERIEHEAATIEYEDLIRAEYKIDKDEPEWKQTQEQERLRKRQRHLLMRYALVLVPSPAEKYLGQAAVREGRTHPPFREMLRQEWKIWFGYGLPIALVIWAVSYVLSQVMKSVWHSFMG